MKRKQAVSFIAGAAVTTAALAIAGCNTGCPGLVAAADQFVNRDVGPKYVDYVNADSTLDATQKQRRLLSVEQFRQAVEANKTQQED